MAWLVAVALYKLCSTLKHPVYSILPLVAKSVNQTITAKVNSTYRVWITSSRLSKRMRKMQ